MRRLVPILATLAVALAGCGGGDSAGPLEGPLAYMPTDTPFVMAIETDLEGDQYKSLDRIIGRFPGGDQIKQRLRQQIEQGEGGIKYEDLKELLGNPFVVSGTDVQRFLSGSEDNDFVAAIQLTDKDKVEEVLRTAGAESKGEVAGATLYEDNGSAYAVEEDILVAAGTEEQLRAALERADGEDHLTEDTFTESVEGLPEEILARGYFDVAALVEADPDAATARKIKWVSALTTFGFTIAAEDDGLQFDFNLKSDGEDLSEEDVPLAAGEQSPRTLRQEGRISVALRDPSQVVRFFEQAFQVAGPQEFSDYSTAKVALEKQLDLDVDRDVIDQLSKDLSVTVGVDGSFAGRAEPEDPRGFPRTIDKIADALPRLAGGDTRVTRRGDLYVADFASGDSLAFGMDGDAFLFGSDPARARSAGESEPDDVSGAEGSLVVTADAESVARELLEQLGPQLGFGGSLAGGLFARPLGELNGSINTTPEGMRGSFKLGVD
jgi:hypothetical protein